MLQSQYDKYQQLGLNIALYRKLNHLSQSSLAELVDISPTHMSRIETAQCAASLDLLFSICDTLRVEPAKLFEFRL